jgi:hypothetical protein
MGELDLWRERASNWRAMAQDCNDPVLQQQLLALADDADDVEVEIRANHTHWGASGGNS